jgi:hypothetical protein
MDKNSAYLLWHVHHRAEEDGEIRHFKTEDDFWADEEGGDDVKLLGVYSSREKAESRIIEARQSPGFSNEPLCFHIDHYTIDDDEWTEGFVTV